VRKIEDIRELLGFEEIILTGGEPTLLGLMLNGFVYSLKDLGYKGKIFLYTATVDIYSPSIMRLLRDIDGITYTIHAEANDGDIKLLKSLSSLSILGYVNFSSRLIIDSRVFEKYDLSNINLNNWDVIRKLQWKDYCPPAENEELVEFLL
jgi:hypothetical protein